jgi:AcrR family transcriptional regulator
MPRAALSPDRVEQFRDELCRVATLRFAEHGYGGVTLRALAAELGCSAMTPYRYFENKAAIFEAVRLAAFDRFADAQEAAAAGIADPIERLGRLGRAYVRFALEEPHSYRIMFELDADDVGSGPRGPEMRSWATMRAAVGDAVRSGALAGDPHTLAHLFWAQVHGLVTLHLAGKFVLDRTLEALLDHFFTTIQSTLLAREPERSSP